MLTRGPKRQKIEFVLSKDDPNLEGAKSDKSILKCLSCLGSPLTTSDPS